jgi:hypothetical protein
LSMISLYKSCTTRNFSEKGIEVNFINANGGGGGSD